MCLRTLYLLQFPRRSSMRYFSFLQYRVGLTMLTTFVFPLAATGLLLCEAAEGGDVMRCR